MNYCISHGFLSFCFWTSGFWPNDCAQHGYLSVLSQSHMRLRDEYLNHRDHQEGLDAQAILHSFASTLGQACYFGSFFSLNS